MKKKILKGLVVTVVVVGAFIVGKATEKNNKAIEVKAVYTTSNDNFYIEEGGQITEYSDGSYSYINELKGEYIFQPAVLADWDYNCSNLEQLNNVVNTYIECNKQ